MKLELDHIFILVKPNASVADLVADIGMKEGTSNSHDGQGTANRRFYFENGMLEFLYVRDESEAESGPGKDLKFVERSKNPQASPFGLVLHAGNDSHRFEPFEGWKYQPKYFKNGMTFHIGANSENILEPLCIYVPFFNASFAKNHTKAAPFKTITNVTITSPSISTPLIVAESVRNLTFKRGDEHLLEISFDNTMAGKSKDFRPNIPLVVNW